MNKSDVFRKEIDELVFQYNERMSKVQYVNYNFLFSKLCT